MQFVATELCGAPVNGKEEAKRETVCTGSEKSLKFHQMDTLITSTELWVTWHKNEGELTVVCVVCDSKEFLCTLYLPCTVFNWTNEDVLNWLEHYVELPEYSTAFRKNQITGRQLPFIAINAGQILQNVLFITDGQHKQKIQLRAMDVILFGPPVQHGHWKLKILVFLIFCGTIYALWQKRLSKAHIDFFMENLRVKEEEIKRLKSKFEALGRELVDGPSISNNENQEDIRDSPPPLMMAPTTSSSSSEDDSSSPISHCKYVCLIFPLSHSSTDDKYVGRVPAKPTTPTLLLIGHSRVWNCFSRGCGTWRESLV